MTTGLAALGCPLDMILVCKLKVLLMKGLMDNGSLRKSSPEILES